MNDRENSNRSKAKVSKKIFAGYARYYNLLYRDKDYRAEANYVDGLIRRSHPEARSILELGSGTGKHSRLLADRGYRVHGIERSPEMLAQSLDVAAVIQQDPIAPRLSFSQGDIRTARLHEQFDAVIALFHVISYQTANEDVMAAFETARQHLKPGGIFIFDVWYGPAVLVERPAVRIKRMADENTEITRTAEPELHPNENRVDVHYHVLARDLSTQAIAELKETHSMRYFFKPEIELIAARKDLQTLFAEEWLTGKPIGPDTWGCVFILKAIQKSETQFHIGSF